MVVEDNPLVRRCFVRLLRSLGYRVREAADYAQALQELSGIRKIDLLFSDIVLPGGKDGWHLANAAAAMHPDLKICLTTGFKGAALPYMAEKRRWPILEKPYNMDELSKFIRGVENAVAPRPTFEGT